MSAPSNAATGAPPDQSPTPPDGFHAPLGASTSDDPSKLWQRRLRRAAPLIALAVALVIVAVIVTPEPDSGLPLDPDSYAPDGTRAVVEILQALDRSVAVVRPSEFDQVVPSSGLDDTGAVVLLLRDQLSSQQRAQLVRRVDAGTRLVVTDPTSPLAPEVVDTMPWLEPPLRRACAVDALADVGRIDPFGGALYEVTDDADGCYDVDDAAWLVVRSHGRGEIIATGSPSFLANDTIGEADNAVLAVHLLAPGDVGGPTIVRPVLRAAGEEGTQTLGDLIPQPLRVAFWQVLAGFLVLVVWRARRLGRPLEEYAPVRLASSDLTAAVGALLGRNAGRAAAAGRIADQTRRRLARMLDLPATVDVDVLAERVAARTSYDAATVARTLSPPDPATDAALLAATSACSDLEDAVSTRLAATVEELDVR